MASPNPKSPSYFFVKSEASMSWDSMNRDNSSMKKYESRLTASKSWETPICIYILHTLGSRLGELDGPPTPNWGIFVGILAGNVEILLKHCF